MFSDYNTYAQYYGLNSVGGNNGLSNGFDFRNMNSGFVDIGNDEVISFSQGVYLLKNMLNEAERKTFKLNHLLGLTNSESEKVLINQILDNHRVHDRILKDVYYRITGQMVNGNFGNSNVGDEKVVGDKKYGEIKDKEPRLYLHANRLKMYYPELKKDILFETPIPNEFKKLIK